MVRLNVHTVEMPSGDEMLSYIYGVIQVGSGLKSVSVYIYRREMEMAILSGFSCQFDAIITL